LCSLFAFAISAVTSAEEVNVFVGFSGDCGAGCFANATEATRVKAKLIIILRIKPPSVLPLASASYASPAFDTTICRRNQGKPVPPVDKQNSRDVAQRINQLPKFQKLQVCEILSRALFGFSLCIIAHNL
jgi:hypothetical protein